MAEVLTTLEGVQEFAEKIDWYCWSLDDLGSLAYVAHNKGYWYEAKELEEFGESLKQHIVAEFCEHPEKSRWYHSDDDDDLTNDYFCEDCGAHSWDDD